MDNSCGFDGGDNDHPGCGQPATLHLFAGKPPATIGDYAMLACDRHAENAKKLAIDWHPVDPVCGVPDSMWQFKAEQGRGFCFWPYAEKAIHDAASQGLGQKSQKHAGT
jgi:hypothetical protein